MFDGVARRIVENFTQQQVVAISRFETGLAHYVYAVKCEDGREIVARLAQPGREASLAGGVYWSEKLRPRGIPLPQLLGYDLTRRQFECAYLLLERLPGLDLGLVYPDLTVDQKRALAREIAAIQRSVNALPLAPGYGYATGYTVPLKPTWAEVVYGELNKNKEPLKQAGVFPSSVINRIEKALGNFEDYFAAVAPSPFLDDTTT